jgi:hypothetical protein
LRITKYIRGYEGGGGPEVCGIILPEDIEYIGARLQSVGGLPPGMVNGVAGLTAQNMIDVCMLLR